MKRLDFYKNTKLNWNKKKLNGLISTKYELIPNFSFNLIKESGLKIHKLLSVWNLAWVQNFDKIWDHVTLEIIYLCIISVKIETTIWLLSANTIEPRIQIHNLIKESDVKIHKLKPMAANPSFIIKLLSIY